jgi:hypothetical protein
MREPNKSGKRLIAGWRGTRLFALPPTRYRREQIGGSHYGSDSDTLCSPPVHGKGAKAIRPQAVAPKRVNCGQATCQIKRAWPW